MFLIVNILMLFGFGFVVGKFYSLLVVWGNYSYINNGGKIGFPIVGACIIFLYCMVAILLYTNFMYVGWPGEPVLECSGTEFLLNSCLDLGPQPSLIVDIIAVVMIGIGYPLAYWRGTWIGYSGINHTMVKRLIHRDRVLKAIVRTMIPKGGKIDPDDKQIDEAVEIVKKMFREKKIPDIFDILLTVLMIVIDSKICVFIVMKGKKWKHFVDMKPEEKTDYIMALNKNTYSNSLVSLLKIIACYGFYTQQKVDDYIGCKGRPYVKDKPPPCYPPYYPPKRDALPWQSS